MNENINDLEKEINKLKGKLDEIKNSQINNYKLVKYCGFEWYIIDESNGHKLLFMKNSINPDKIKDYFKLDYMLDSWNDVKFNREKNSNWKDSYIRMVLNSTFLAELNINELNIMKIKVNDEITSDYVRLITKEEVKKLPDYVRENQDRQFGYWTMSSYNDSLVWLVDSDGTYVRHSPVPGYGVRPVISLKSSAVLEYCDKNEEA